MWLAEHGQYYNAQQLKVNVLTQLMYYIVSSHGRIKAAIHKYFDVGKMSLS